MNKCSFVLFTFSVYLNQIVSHWPEYTLKVIERGVKRYVSCFTVSWRLQYGKVCLCWIEYGRRKNILMKIISWEFDYIFLLRLCILSTKYLVHGYYILLILTHCQLNILFMVLNMLSTTERKLENNVFTKRGYVRFIRCTGIKPAPYNAKHLKDQQLWIWRTVITEGLGTLSEGLSMVRETIFWKL